MFKYIKQTNKRVHVPTTIRAALPAVLLHKISVFIALSFFGPNDASWGKVVYTRSFKKKKSQKQSKNLKRAIKI